MVLESNIELCVSKETVPWRVDTRWCASKDAGPWRGEFGSGPTLIGKRNERCWALKRWIGWTNHPLDRCVNLTVCLGLVGSLKSKAQRWQYVLSVVWTVEDDDKKKKKKMNRVFTVWHWISLTRRNWEGERSPRSPVRGAWRISAIWEWKRMVDWE